MPWRHRSYPLSRRRARRGPIAWLRRHRHQAGIVAFVALGLAGLSYPVLEKLSRWPLTVALRHAAATPNCTAARAVGLAPAYRGQPGYYPQHDRDRDGIACEPWPRR
jgi:hypothetical protein